jgi:acetyltransferase-like isoleucine patch superfamily enzyme
VDREEIKSGTYSDVEYLQFRSQGPMAFMQRAIGVLTWPLVWPLAMLARVSDIMFRSLSEFLSILPYFPGVILRYEFYRFALRRCGKNVLIEFGAIFIYRDVEIGDNVLIGRYSIVHHCNFGSDVLVGERCTFLSGMRQHRYERTDIPMTQQGGAKKRIVIGDDCWVGSHCVVMDDIAGGCVLGAGSVVSKPIPASSIAVGVPAQVIRRRADQIGS